MRVLTICVAIGLVFTGMRINLANKWSSENAMKVCQLSHSHDVCFQALNR